MTHLRKRTNNLSIFNARLVEKIPSIAIISATVALTACGGGGGGGSEQPALDQDCVNVFSNAPFNWTAEQLQAACSDVGFEDADDFDDDDNVNNVGGGNFVPPAQPNDVPVDPPAPSITPSATPALYTAPADVPGGMYFQNSNNSAILNGPLFGSGSRSNDSLVKPLAFNVDSAVSGLQMIELRAVEDETSRVSLLGVLQNTGSTIRCFVEAVGISEYSSTGAALAGGLFDFAFSTGVVGARPTGTIQTDTCINPGSLAYIDYSAGSSLAEIAEVTIDSLEALDGDYAQIGASVIPITYSIGTNGVNVTFVNQHSASVELFAVQAFALDQNGQAIATDTNVVSESIDPGQEYVVEGVFSDFPGQASTMRVTADFNL